MRAGLCASCRVGSRSDRLSANACLTVVLMRELLRRSALHLDSCVKWSPEHLWHGNFLRQNSLCGRRRRLATLSCQPKSPALDNIFQRFSVKLQPELDILHGLMGFGLSVSCHEFLRARIGSNVAGRTECLVDLYCFGEPKGARSDLPPDLVRSRHRVQGRSSSVRERLLSGSVHAVRQRREHECSAYRPDVPRGPWMAFPVQVQDKSAVAPPVWTNRTLLPAGIHPARTLPTSPENTFPV